MPRDARNLSLLQGSQTLKFKVSFPTSCAEASVASETSFKDGHSCIVYGLSETLQPVALIVARRAPLATNARSNRVIMRSLSTLSIVRFLTAGTGDESNSTLGWKGNSSSFGYS